MEALAVGAEIAGIICGLAILVGFTIWVWRWRDHTHKSIDKLSTQAAELQTRVKALQEQVAKLNSSEMDFEYAMLKAAANTNVVVEQLQKDVAQLRTEMDERNEVADKQAQLNSYFQVNLNDLDTRLTPLQAQVKDLSNGIMPRVGGTHPAE